MILTTTRADLLDGDVLIADPPSPEDVELQPASVRQTTSSETGDRLLEQWVEAAERDVWRYPHASKPLIDLAHALVNVGRIEDAHEMLTRAIAIDPDSYAANYSLADVALKLNN